ncbi:AMP-binding protein [Undibacterium arcticum]
MTPLNLLAQASQLEYVLNHSDATIIFVTPDQLERLNAALVNVAREIQIVVCDVDAEEFIAAPDRIAEMPPVSEEHDALMMYTSGTTGKPKGVVLTNRSVVSGGQFVSAAHELGPQDRVMASLPLYHINAQIVTATAPLVHGGSLVLPHRFGVSNFWSLVARYQCSWINLVPTMISYLLNGQEAAKKMIWISAASASAVRLPLRCRPASIVLLKTGSKIGVIETMGLTETAAPCFTNPLESAQRKIGSPGQAFW